MFSFLFGDPRACGVTRSPQWGKVRRAWLLAHDRCACCSTKNDLEVHHIVPVHVDPTRELDGTNLVTLCRRCHLFVGHLGDWESWNVQVLEHAQVWSRYIAARPCLKDVA